MGQFSVNILSLGKQPYGTRFQQGIGLAQQFGQRRQRSRRDDLDASRRVFDEIRDAFGMNHRWNPGRQHRFAQERRLFANAFDEMDFDARLVRQRAGDRETGKARATPKIDPDFGARSEIEELQ